MKKRIFSIAALAAASISPAFAQEACAPASIPTLTQIQMAQLLPPAVPTPAPLQAASATPPALQKLIAGGNRLEFIGEVGGLKSYVAIGKNDNFMLVHVTPDGRHMIVGVVYNEQGQNVTNPMVERSNIAAALVGPAPAAAAPQEMPAVAKLAGLQALPGVVWGTSPFRINVVVDTRCSYSRVALQKLKRYVDDGTLSVNVVPASILANPEDGARQGMAMLRNGPAAVEAWVSNRRFDNLPPSGAHAGTSEQDLVNIVLAATKFVGDSGFRATPGFAWQAADGAHEALGADDSHVANMVRMAKTPR